MNGFYPGYSLVGPNILDSPEMQHLQKCSQEWAQYNQRVFQPPLPPPEVVPPPPPMHPQQNIPNRQNYRRYNSKNQHIQNHQHIQSYQHMQNHHHSSNNHHNSNNRHNNSSSSRQQITSRSPQPLKRPMSEDDDFSKSQKSRKKKKSLAVSNMTLRNWSEEAAKKALEAEKELNGLHSQKQLIIKFPDEDLNRDIVHRFHSSITNVHFQQPSTPRFCFITLEKESNPEEVMKVLNKTPFGHGFLTVEYKNQRQDPVTDPRILDVCTLYVGNLPSDVKQHEVYQLYPESRRIDIGFATLMRGSRYAMVHFHTAEDALKAFRRTHGKNSPSNSKTLIVRFRRLNGSASMPNERKLQNPPRCKDGEELGVDDHVGSEYCCEEEDEEDSICKEAVENPSDEEDTTRQVSAEVAISHEEDPVQSSKQKQTQPEDRGNAEPAVEKTSEKIDKPAEESFTLPSVIKIKEEPIDEPSEDSEVPMESQLPAEPLVPKTEKVTEIPMIDNVPIKTESDDLAKYRKVGEQFEIADDPNPFRTMAVEHYSENEDTTQQASTEQVRSHEENPIESSKQKETQSEARGNTEPAIQKTIEKIAQQAEETFTLPSVTEIKKEPMDEPTKEPEVPLEPQLPVQPRITMTETITAVPMDVDLPIKTENDDQAKYRKVGEEFEIADDTNPFHSLRIFGHNGKMDPPCAKKVIVSFI